MKENKINLLTIGDTSVDLYMKVEDASVQCDVNHENCQICFDYADKIPVEAFEVSVAGNSANVAMGANLLGLKVGIYSEVGDDSNGDLVIETLNERGIDTKHCNKNPGMATNVHPIIVFEGERTIFSYHAHYEYKMQNWPTPKILYYTSLSKNFVPFQKELIKYLEKNSEIIFVMNPGSTMLKTDIKALTNTFGRLDILFVNKNEAQEILEKEAETDELLKMFYEKGVKMPVITDSTNGSATYDGEKVYKQGICPVVKVQDKTGAGDAFASGFISAIYYGKNAREALKWGAINSSSVITRIGATNGLKSKQEIENMLKNCDFMPDSL